VVSATVKGPRGTSNELGGGCTACIGVATYLTDQL